MNTQMENYVLGGIVIFVIVIATFIGWVYAHQTVAKECERLGAFYVGDKTYECRVK